MPAPRSGERWLLLAPHLERALELGEAEREAWLASLRATDPDLAADLAALLAEHEEVRSSRFLAESAAPSPPASLAGQRLGAYTLRSPLGEGGMGSVWLAERSDGRFTGAAAVKLLNVSLLGHGGEERFRREGSILAR